MMRKLVVIVGVALLVLVVLSPTVAEAAAGPRIVDAQIDGRSLMHATRDHPVYVSRASDVPMTVTVRNDGFEDAHVRYLRVSFSLLGIRFAHFDGSVDQIVRAGTTATISVKGDFYDVDQAGIGWTDARIAVIDDSRHVIAAHGFAADIPGKVFSSEGFLLLEILAVAVIGLLQLGFGIARRRLPLNRLVRALLFALTGGSAVVVIVMAAAVARVVLIPSVTWVPIVLIVAIVAFVLGFLTPAGRVRSAKEAADDRVIDLVASEAVARASGEYARRTTGGSVSHASGDHSSAAAQHASGEFNPASAHDSGTHEPLQ